MTDDLGNTGLFEFWIQPLFLPGNGEWHLALGTRESNLNWAGEWQLPMISLEGNAILCGRWAEIESESVR